MAGNTRWTRDKDGLEHPDDSDLLAYVRRQQLEDRLSIRRHIEQCPFCRRKCSMFASDSETLSVLARMRAYQQYPERTPGQTLEYVISAAQQPEPLGIRVLQQLRAVAGIDWPRRPSKRMLVLRFSSAVALALLLVLLAFEMVLAFQRCGFSLPFLFTHMQVSGGPANLSVVERHYSTPTPSPAQGTATATSASPTASPGTRPYIEVCSTPDEFAQYRLAICGYNFKPGDRVSLIVVIPGRLPVTRRALTVNAQGIFRDSWNITSSCKYLPAVISVHDMTHPAVHSNILENIEFPGCPMPTPSTGWPPGGTSSGQH